jgi:uncharacterized MAPEG superfamily protein
MGATFTALLAFAGWFVLLTFALGAVRSGLVLSGKKAANSFATDGSDIGGFAHRLNRARDNCFETLPVFASIALVASATNRLSVTDPLAMYLLYARIGQSVTHIASTSIPAINVRFALFAVQLVIYTYWIIQLIG